MSQEREINSGEGVNTRITPEEKPSTAAVMVPQRPEEIPEEEWESFSPHVQMALARDYDTVEHKNRIASVLERGFTSDRLQVDGIPEYLHGEWAPNTPEDIARYEAMGFWVDDQFAVSRSLHSDGSSNRAIIGDAIHMVCTRKNKEVIDALDLDRRQKRHGKPERRVKGEGSKEQVEESRSYGDLVKTRLDMPVIDESTTTKVDGRDIEEILSGGKD